MEHERALLAAAEEGCVEKISHILAHGMSPDIIVDGWTALEKASINNQCDIIRILIKFWGRPEQGRW